MTLPLADSGSLVAAFAEQVGVKRDSTAVWARDGSLTYGQLDSRSTAVARQLVAGGASGETVVALFTGRTTALVVGILAALKAGAAFLPIDPAHPGERLRKLVELSGVTQIVTTGELWDDIAARSDVHALKPVLCDVPHQPVVGAALPDRQPSSLAYVLPTSGSTGEPKGVQIEDRNVLDLVRALNEALLEPLGPGLRIAVVAPYVFDASIQQIFSALLLGHTLAIVPETDRGDGTALRRFWHDHEIDVSDGTPMHLRLLSEAREAPPISVRQLLIGGEALTREGVKEFYDKCAAYETTIANLYGVAECCVDSTFELVRAFDADEEGESVPIGRELPGTVIRLLDENREPVADGETGEVCIGGAGVGRGYLGLPELTADRFIEQSDQAADRFYRTGDLARRLPDGRLAFLGRRDREIKLRGHRIDPAEVEAVLCRYAGPPESGTSEGAREARACERCLLTSAYPGVKVVDGVCTACRNFDDYREAARDYFRDTGELVENIRRRSTASRSGYDVLLLFSGGKDSSYALYKLLDFGFRVLAFTFDNGYISERAFENIRRITANAGVDLEIGEVAAMNDVFTESLRTESTVCSGCFRGLTALSTRLAAERGIGVIATGLSRGQIYDTKLQRLFEAGVRDPDEVDRRLLVHRKIYHARRDRTFDLLSTSLSEEMLEDILFLDYFRYDAVTSAQIKQYLADRDPLWSEPSDTGLCSTNCRINDVGIYVHSAELGFHNYASPLSWDCRLGVLDREQGLSELSEVVPHENVREILDRLGYSPESNGSIRQAAVVTRRVGTGSSRQMRAFYVAPKEIDPAALRDHMAAHVPGFMVPAVYTHLTQMPVTDVGKIDYDVLSTAEDGSPPAASDERPMTATEEGLSAIWRETLAIDRVSRTADFFLLGGDSLTATIVAGIAQSEFGISVTPVEFFTDPTLMGCAALVDRRIAETKIASSGVVLRSLNDSDTAGDGYLLLPDVTGSVEMYRPLAARVATAMSGLSGPSLLGATGDSSIETFCEVFLDTIKTDRPSGPYRLAGWSFGGILALEIARRLTALGEPVEHLVIMDIMPPSTEYWSEQLWQWQEFSDGANGSRRPVPDSLRQVFRPHSLHGHVAVDAYARAALPVLRALTVFEPEGTLTERLTFIRASASAEEPDEARWREFSRRPPQTAVIDGDHFSILEPGSADRLAPFFATSTEPTAS